MFCPVCSQEQISDETRFCSRCGFLLTGVSQVIANGGVLPHLPPGDDPNALSPRRQGIKQGAVLVFSSFIIVPILAIITLALRIEEPFAVVIALFLTFVAGLLRMLYAFLFESKTPGAASQSVLPGAFQNVLPSKKQVRALPHQQGPPISSYVPPAAAAAASGNWRDTNDLAVSPPPSVTDPTTKLFQKDE